MAGRRKIHNGHWASRAKVHAMTRRMEKSRVSKKPVPLTPYVDMVSPSHGLCASSDVDFRPKFLADMRCDGIVGVRRGGYRAVRRQGYAGHDDIGSIEMADLRMSWLLIAVAAWSSSSEAGAAPLADGPVYGPELQGYEYPYPVHDFQFVSQRQRLDLV